MKLTDEELIAAIESEESVALDAHSGELREDRAEAWARYRGEPLGNEVEGRSQIVDKGVMDTIQWIVPSLVRIYLGGDDIGQFEPIGPEDEYAAECETEVCNWYLQAKNDFYSHIVATLTDALLLKNGYIAGNWTTRNDVMVERYQGLAEEEFALILQDQDVEVVEHTAMPDPMSEGMQPQFDEMGQPVPPPMLHDVKIERKKAEEFVGIESIPPDEMLVSRRHRWTSLADADFVQWRRQVTIGQLRAEGFDVPDDATEYSDFGIERLERERFEEDRVFNDETPDPSRKLVLFKDTYIRIDLQDKGTPQLWRVAYVDGAREPTLKEEADCVPFAAFAPIIYPHSHIGTSIFDLIDDICNIKTMMERQLIDGTFLQTAGRMAVDVNTVNVDDLLVSRPGGIIRVEGDPGASMFPIVTPDVGPTVMGALEYMDGIKEGRTGVTRYSAGLDANTLNKTATGMQQIAASANQRIELIARTLAGGFRDLFLIIHTLASKHSTKPVQMKLKGNWQAIDPRSWAKRTDFKINVGLGTGTPEQQAQKLMMMQPIMQQAMGMGLAGPQEAYNFGAEMWKALGYKTPDKFLKPPQKDEQGQPVMPPPQKDPMVQAAEIRAQADGQANEMKAQGEAQKFQAQQQADIQKFQATQQADIQRFQAEQQAGERAAEREAALKREEMQMNMQVQASNDQRQAELDRQKMQLDVLKMEKEFEFKMWLETAKMQATADLERQRMQHDGDTQRTIARASGIDVDVNNTDDKVAKALLPIMQQMQAVMAGMAAPKEIVRGPDGRAVGVRTVQ